MNEKLFQADNDEQPSNDRTKKSAGRHANTIIIITIGREIGVVVTDHE